MTSFNPYWATVITMIWVVIGIGIALLIYHVLTFERIQK